jgi:hypothetical protein
MSDMTDMSKGFLSFCAEPLPHHERLLERLGYYIENRFPASNVTHVPEQVRSTEETSIVSELMFRVCGVTLPTPGGDASVPQAYVQALQELYGIVEFDLSRDTIKGAMTWVMNTYHV